MKESRYLIYQKFSNKNEANELKELLIENNIEFLFEFASANFDPSFANDEVNKEFRIKLKRQDFEKADKLMMTVPTTLLNEVDKDYYLFKFTDEELIEVLTKSDEWSKFDYLLAQKILEDRGQEIDGKSLGAVRDQGVEELTKSDESHSVLVTMGYVFAFLGGLLGLFIGWYLLSHKETLPNGDIVYGYSVEERKNGKRILIIGIVFLTIWTIIRIKSNN